MYSFIGKIWMKNITKLRKQLEKSGKLDSFYKDMDKKEKIAKKFIQDTFRSKNFKVLKKEINKMILPINEYISKIYVRDENKKDLKEWLNSLTK
jgi:hypothetical protein